MFGSPSGGSGKTFYGGIAQLICLGPVQTLHQVLNGDTPIWTGPLDRSSADSAGKSILSTTIGTLYFYWGTADQTPDPILTAAKIDLGDGPQTVPIPAWPWICYATGGSICFGSQQSPPQLQFELTVSPADLSLSAHLVNGDAVIPEIIYQYLTRALLGLGIDAVHIDADSFSAAAETVIAEGIGVSPTIDANSTAREIIGKLLQYVDGVLYFKDGKIHMRLMRAESTAGLQTIGIADMIDEPQPVNEGDQATWSITNVSFTDRDGKYETSTEPYHDGANSSIFGGSKRQDVDLPYIRTRDVAKKLAKLIGVKGGLVPMTWTLQLKPSWATLSPGDRLFIAYEKLGITNRLVRVTDIDRGTPENPEVQITVTEEMTRGTSHDYVPEDEQSLAIQSVYDTTGATSDVITSTVPRLSWLPSVLKGSYPDGFLVAVNRPDTLTTAASIYWTWDTGSVPYKLLTRQTSWPAKGTVVCWHRVRDTHWLLRVKCDTAADYQRLKDLLDMGDVHAVTGKRTVKLVGATQDQHQAEAGWSKRVAGGYSDLVTADTIDIEVDAGQFGSDPFTLETNSAAATAPAQHVYIGRQGTASDFAIVRSAEIAFERNAPNAPLFHGVSPDTALVRYIKVPVGKLSKEQAVSDVDPVTFDRDDTTMCPDGTYSRDWGSRARSTYELFDVETPSAINQAPSAAYATVQDIDQALAAVIVGTATPVQVLLVEDVDLVLGVMLETGSKIYNDSP